MINTYIPIIGKIVLIFLNKFEEQIKVRNYHFIDMTIWNAWVFWTAKCFIVDAQNIKKLC